MASREELLKEFEAMSEEEFAQFTPEELDEIAKTFEGSAVIQTGPKEAYARGLAEEVTFNLSDEIEAAVDTAKELVLGEADEGVGEIYDKKIAAVREEYEAARQQHGSWFLAGQGTGLVGSMLLGGAAVKGAMKGGQVLAKAAAIGAGQGAVAGFGAGEGAEDTLEKTLSGMAIGGAVGAVGGKISQKLATGSRKIAENKAKAMLGITSQKDARALARNLAIEESVDDLPGWIAKMSKKNVHMINEKGELVDSGQRLLSGSLETNIDKLSTHINNLNEARKPLLKSVKISDAQDVISQASAKLQAEIADVGGSPANVKMVQAQIETLKENLTKRIRITNKAGEITTETEARSNISLLDVFNVRKTIDASINSSAWDAVDPALKHKVSKVMRTSLNDFIDSNLDEAAKAGKVTDKFIRDELRNSHFLKDHLSAVAISSKSKWKPVSDGIAALTVGGIADKVIGVGPGSAGAVAAFTLLLKQLSRSPAFNKGMAVNMFKAANLLESKGSDAAIAMSRLAVASEYSPDFLGKVINSYAAQYDLQQTPVNRSVDDVINRQNLLLPIAEDASPELAAALRNGIRSNDRDMIAATMDELSKNPEVRRFIKDGVGFDGKVWNEEDKITLINQLDSLDISHRQRLELKNKLVHEDLVPQVQREEDPFLKYQKRNKQEPKF